jgi:hypothetical protein
MMHVKDRLRAVKQLCDDYLDDKIDGTRFMRELVTLVSIHELQVEVATYIQAGCEADIAEEEERRLRKPDPIDALADAANFHITHNHDAAGNCVIDPKED